MLIRTISVSATIPEDDDDDDVFEESDPEIEYELQVKPKSQQTDKVPSMAASGMAMHMEVVAVPKKETEFNMMSLLGTSL